MKNYYALFTVVILLISANSCKPKPAAPLVETTISSMDSNETNTPSSDPKPAEVDVVTSPKTEPEIKVTQPKTDIRTYETDGMLHGTMMVKGNDWIIRSDDGGEIKDYFPTNLTDDFKVEGLTVGFKGTVQEIPTNVRMVGAPIELSKIIKMTIKN